TERRHGGGRYGGEAAVADAVQNGDAGAAAAPGQTLEPAAHLRRQVLLELTDTRLELRNGIVDVDVELLLLDCAAALVLEQLTFLRLQILDLEQDLELGMHGHFPAFVRRPFPRAATGIPPVSSARPGGG